MLMLKLMTDFELNDIISQSLKSSPTGKWFWSKIAPIIPNILTMEGPSIKVDLLAVEKVESPNFRKPTKFNSVMYLTDLI